MINWDFEEFPFDVTEHIEKFRLFLIACWPSLDNLMEYHDWDDDGWFIDDWLQANWELLVEREILQGRDFLTQFSITHLGQRVIAPEKNPGCTIVAKAKNSDIVDARSKKTIPFDKPLRLFSFSSKINGGFGLYPPFDFANLVEDRTNELFLASISELEFHLIRLSTLSANE